MGFARGAFIYAIIGMWSDTGGALAVFMLFMGELEKMWSISRFPLLDVDS